jgi:hypothetical protein
MPICTIVEWKDVLRFTMKRRPLKIPDLCLPKAEAEREAYQPKQLSVKPNQPRDVDGMPLVLDALSHPMI